MKTIRLTRRAAARLEEIAGWTIDRFGPEQARIYETQLIHRLQALATGEPPHGKPCEIAGGTAGAAGADSLQYYREGGHYIVFRETADTLIVIDFVHGARNLERISRRSNPPYPVRSRSRGPEMEASESQPSSLFPPLRAASVRRTLGASDHVTPPPYRIPRLPHRPRYRRGVSVRPGAAAEPGLSRLCRHP